MSLLSNVVQSQVTKSERWLKLYRIIHHLFLKEEFIHTVDYNLMVTQMNARITELEAKLMAELTARDLRFATHFHMAPQAPTGTLPTLPPTIPYKNSLAPTKPVVVVTSAMQAADAALMATGPAQAPLSDGIAPDEMRANSTVIADIGF